MSQQTVTELVITSDTSGADQFSQSMDRAGDSAQKGSTSVAGMTLAIAGVSIAVVGAIVALRGFIDYVGQQSQALVDMANHAELAGMSAKEFQQTLFAARAAGLTEKDFVSGLDKISADLTQASQGVTEFGKLFAANEVSLRNQNGQLKTAKEALTDIMGLMQGATPQVAQRLAQIVGLSQSWIPFLKQGEDAFEAQKKAAADLGVIIDDSTIAKAKEFNAQWKTAVATWDLQFKASLASILPLLVQMATLASKIIEGIGSVSGAAGRLMTPDEDKTVAQLNDQINEVYRLRTEIEKLGGIDLNTFAGFRTGKLASSLGLPEDATIQQVDAMLDKLSALYDKPARVAVTGGTFDTVLPKNDDANDAVDRAINTLRRHTEQQLADSAAIGQGVGIMALFRAQAAETAAVQANQGKETAEQAAKFNTLKQAAADAAVALERAKVAENIRFGSNTGFLSQADVAVAQQLKGIYPDVAQALGSVEAQAIRLNGTFREMSTAIENNLTSGLTDIVTGTKSVSKGFTDMGLAIVKAIDQAIIKILIVEPLMRALQQSISGSGILNFLTPIGSTGGGAASTGAAGVGGIGGLYHSGGIVGAEPTSTRYVHPAYFDHAPKFHGGGIAGDEVPIIARRGEGVFTQGQMAAMGGGGGSKVEIHNYPAPNTRTETRTRQRGDGTTVIEQFAVMLNQTIASGNADKAFGSRFGARPGVTPR